MGQFKHYFGAYHQIMNCRGGKIRKPGAYPEMDPEEQKRVTRLKNELDDLEKRERTLDTHIKWMRQVALMYPFVT